MESIAGRDEPGLGFMGRSHPTFEGGKDFAKTDRGDVQNGIKKTGPVCMPILCGLLGDG